MGEEKHTAWVQGYDNWCNVLWRCVGPLQAKKSRIEESGFRYRVLYMCCDMAAVVAKDHASAPGRLCLSFAQTVVCRIKMEKEGDVYHNDMQMYATCIQLQF